MQLLAWGIFIGIAPVIAYYAGAQTEDASILFHMLLSIIFPAAFAYFINYYLLVPALFFKERKGWFIISNLIILIACNFHLFISIFIWIPDIPHYWIGAVAGLSISFVLDIVSLGIAIGIRNYLRTIAIKQKLAEETHRRTEAELMWLKNQLNPHFLFNSLNNISSLIWIDAERAQNSIGELSDLLRYAIYESEKKLVPLQKEFDFMRNYISLMSLRCNDMTDILVSFDIEDPKAYIAPLLLISLVENAFKHGVSASQPSFLNFKINEKNHILTFICENSDFHKSDRDNSGSGIGIPNMRKRLELLYPGHFEWEQDANGDLFRVKVTLHLEDSYEND